MYFVFLSVSVYVCLHVHKVCLHVHKVCVLACVRKCISVWMCICVCICLCVYVYLCAGAPGRGIATAVVPYLVPLLRFVRFPLMSPEHLVLDRVLKNKHAPHNPKP